jgi:putative flippase GtrA
MNKFSQLFGVSYRSSKFIRYSLVGFFTNFIGYGIYLIFTYLGVTPKLTITVLYFFGALLGFFTNRRFTFNYGGNVFWAVCRYVIAQLLGYLLNLFFLFLFVDKLGIAHQIVQALAILVVALFLFFLSYTFVFPQKCRYKRI